jgi:hypothetical protein
VNTFAYANARVILITGAQANKSDMFIYATTVAEDWILDSQWAILQKIFPCWWGAGRGGVVGVS